MVTEGENSIPSGSGAMATLSQNRPMDRTFRRLCSNKRLEPRTVSLVSCSLYAGSSSAPVTEYFSGCTE